MSRRSTPERLDAARRAAALARLIWIRRATRPSGGGVGRLGTPRDRDRARARRRLLGGRLPVDLRVNGKGPQSPPVYPRDSRCGRMSPQLRTGSILAGSFDRHLRLWVRESQFNVPARRLELGVGIGQSTPRTDLDAQRLDLRDSQSFKCERTQLVVLDGHGTRIGNDIDRRAGNQTGFVKL
jgi:hypothetical protein